MQMFLKNQCLRPSCYSCKVKENKNSDLTIGDFWGIDEVDSSMNDGIGCSLVFIRTEKGKKIFSQIRNKMKVKEVSYESGIKYNSAEYQSVSKPESREKFYYDLNSLTFTEMGKKYIKKENIFRKLLSKLKKVLVLLYRGGEREELKNENYGLKLEFIKIREGD